MGGICNDIQLSSVMFSSILLSGSWNQTRSSVLHSPTGVLDQNDRDMKIELKTKISAGTSCLAKDPVGQTIQPSFRIPEGVGATLSLPAPERDIV